MLKNIVLVSVNNISKEFNGETLFLNVTFNINNKDRIGLAGKNGAGKTTLLRIIFGDLKPGTGQIVIPDELNIGYLPQEKVVNSRRSVLDEVMTVYAHIQKLKDRNEEIMLLLSDADEAFLQSKEAVELLEEHAGNENRISIAEPEKFLGKAERILTGLGFEREEFNKPLSNFSFGWQMRVEIAKLLLENPFLLLLDEPTNHLDIESIQWLEDYLLNYNGAVIIVSHDRTFLDTLTNRTIEINNGKIYDYKVAYSEFIRLREERLIHQQAAVNNQQKEIREIERFIERFRYKASKARQVQSRVKHLEKMELIETDDLNSDKIRFSFPPAPHSGKITVSGKNISKHYGKKIVLNEIDFQILKGEKIAFVGRNGEGKSTLVKIITKKIPFDGKISPGYNVETGYFSQDQWDMLDPELTVFETLDQVAVGDIRKRLQTILGSFLFQGEDINKKVKILSGGEKSRLALAKLLLTPSNFLVLDEPTNHLDIVSKDILKNALLQFDGTLVIVSHDRDFLQGLTERLYEFKEHKIKEYRGDIFDFLKKRKIAHLKDLEIKDNAENEKIKTSSENKIKYERRKELDKQLRKIDNGISNAEKSIEKLETQLAEINNKLSLPDEYKSEIRSGALYKQHDKVTGDLNNRYENWEKLQKERENLVIEIEKVKQ